MKKRAKYILPVLLILACSSGIAQKLVAIDSIPITYPVAASIDRLNNIYLADKQGNLKQYTNGKQSLVFSPQQSGDITLIEAWNPLKIFLFYADFQEYMFLDRFLTSSQRYSAPGSSGFSRLMTISSDNNLWIVDDVDFGLKKYNINFGKYTIRTPFDLILDREKYEITFIREYQNLVFISDKKSGILIFDNLGNYLRKIPAPGINYFSFRGDDLYYVSHGRLVMVNLYNNKQAVIDIPLDAIYAFYYDDRVSIITASQLKNYQIR